MTNFNVKLVGGKGCELFLSHFLIDSTYTDELSKNYVKIVRHSIGTYVAGDATLLRFFGDSDNVRSVLASPTV